MGNVYDTFGTLLKRGDGGSPEVFATVAGVGDIDGPAEELRTEEYIAHDFAKMTVRRHPTVLDPGQVTFPVFFDPADNTHVLLRQDMYNKTRRNFQLVEPFAGGETASFAAFVTKVGRKYPVAGLNVADLTLSVDSEIDWS